MTELFVAVNAKFPHTNLAVRLLTAVAEKTRLDCGYIEHTINTEKETVISDILSRSPRLVSFSCYIWNITYILSLAKTLKALCPDLQILLGGPEVSFDAEAILSEHPEIGYIIRGEGELAHTDFALFLLGEKALLDCASLTCRTSGQIISTPIRIGNQFETADFPYPDLETLKNRVIYYEASRGCPFACAFCLSSESGGIYEKPLEIVKRDIMMFIQAELKIVKFVDRTFNTDRKRAIEILEFILANSQGTCFHLELAPSLLDDALLNCLAKAKPGIFQLELGIQSTHAPTLAAINRHENFASFAPKIRRLTDMHNMHIHVDLIAGLPYEGLPEFAKSFDDVFSLGADNVQLGFLKLLKGAPLRADAELFGIRYDKTAPYEVIETTWLSRTALLHLEEIEYLLKRFYNSGLFKYTILMLADHIGSAFALFEDLDHLIKAMSIDIKKTSEMQLTEILWQFCEESSSPLCQEMLLFEAMKKKKRPRLPESILTPAHRDFRKTYFKEKAVPQADQKSLFPIFFSYDVLLFIHSQTLKISPKVLLFDYSDFEQGVIIRKG